MRTWRLTATLLVLLVGCRLVRADERATTPRRAKAIALWSTGLSLLFSVPVTAWTVAGVSREREALPSVVAVVPVIGPLTNVGLSVAAQRRSSDDIFEPLESRITMGGWAAAGVVQAAAVAMLIAGLVLDKRARAITPTVAPTAGGMSLQLGGRF
jgi:hypothetical protein